MADESSGGEPASTESIIKQWRREQSQELKAFAEPAVGRRLFKSLSRIKSGYDRLCETKGGPVEVQGFERVNFERSCDQYRVRLFQHLLTRWQTDAASGIRHWPHMAFACAQYAYRRKEFGKDKGNLSPAQVRKMLLDIERSANTFATAICRLQEASHQLSDGSSQAIPHLQWLDQFISQAAAGYVAPNVNEDGLHMLAVFDGKMNFLKRVCEVQAAATEALNRFDPKLIKRPPGAVLNRALRTLVGMAKPIWKSLTGRKPSINKVHTKDGDGTPDFVNFVQELARIGGGPVPTFKQIVIAFRPRRTPK
jgi:hypothetical protein